MLLRLQEADDAIATISSEIGVVQAALLGETELDRRRSRALDAAGASTAAGVQLTNAETQLATLERRTKTLDRKLYDGSVHNPHELLEMQRELEGLRAQLGEAEEQMLALMELNEQTGDAEARARAAVDEIEAQRSEQEGPRRHRLQELERRLAESRAARDAAAASLSAAEQALYARVAARHHPAVVSIKGDTCGGCHIPLSNEERRAVRAGDAIVQCSSCDRILVP